MNSYSDVTAVVGAKVDKNGLAYVEIQMGTVSLSMTTEQAYQLIENIRSQADKAERWNKE